MNIIGPTEKYFYSIEDHRTTSIKIKRSVFTCSLAYADSIETAKGFISGISKENKTATHNCWAYITGEKGEVFHCSDAGEPAGTAGRPMLNTLQSHDMTHIAAVVTRYFGGVKLGIRGLMDAYSLSVEKTIELRKLKKLIRTISLVIEVSYGFNDTLINLLRPYLMSLEDTTYTEKIVHRVDIEMEDYIKVERLLTEYQSRGKLTFRKISGTRP